MTVTFRTQSKGLHQRPGGTTTIGYRDGWVLNEMTNSPPYLGSSMSTTILILYGPTSHEHLLGDSPI